MLGNVPIWTLRKWSLKLKIIPKTLIKNSSVTNDLILDALPKKRPYSELLWPAFSCIRTKCGEIRSISPYSVRMRENADQNNSEYRHFPHSDALVVCCGVSSVYVVLWYYGPYYWFWLQIHSYFVSIMTLWKWHLRKQYITCLGTKWEQIKVNFLIPY